MVWVILLINACFALWTWGYVMDKYYAWAKAQNDDSYNYHTTASKQYNETILTQKDKIIVDFEADDKALNFKQRWIRHAASLWAFYGGFVSFGVYCIVYTMLADAIDWLPPL